MPIFRKTFSQGRMQLDAENRLLQDGEYREATNVIAVNNENGEEGSIRKSYSNKRLTNINLGANPITLGGATYNARNRIYWLVLSDSGSYLLEYDTATQTTSFVLKDTRPIGQRVFDLKKNFPCTAFNIIPHEDPSKELILMTDNNMEPLCINISRAKTYGENGFEIEDIRLIKSPPKYNPNVSLTYTGGSENYMEETFQLFGYRYKYLDGEYSAFSDFTNYQFAPGEFDLDFQSLENKGMINRFNAVKITFDTGNKLVTDIQLVLKKTNSNVPYLIETFNKKDEQWADNIQRNFVFSNDKIYLALPERELFRTFDNVPRKALAQTVIGNKVAYSNYLEGYDMLDSEFKKVNLDYTLSVDSKDISGSLVPITISDTLNGGGKTLNINFDGIELKEGNSVRFDFIMASAYLSGASYVNEGSFDRSIDYILDRNYSSLTELSEDPSFVSFVSDTITAVFNSNIEFAPPTDSSLVNTPIFSFSVSGNTLSISAPTATYRIDNTPSIPDDDDFTMRDYFWYFNDSSTVFYRDFAVSSSCKTNRSYAVGILYMDEPKRKTTVLTSKKNTIYIPQELSVNKNIIKVLLNSLPPYWATSFKFVIKQQPLSYQTIYGLKFYEEGLFRWLKLEGANIDKVNQGDTLIVKSDLAGPVQDVVKVLVLEKAVQDKNFIEDNENVDGDEILEERGVYIKIKPQGFFMDYGSATARTFQGYKKYRYPPRTYTEGPFGETDALTSTFTPYKVGAGSSIRIYINFKAFGSISYNETYDKKFISTQEYPSLKEWFQTEVKNLGQFGKDFTWNGVTDIGGNVEAGYGMADAWNMNSGWGFSDDNKFFVVPHRKGTQSRDIMAEVRFEVLFTSGMMIFETEPKQIENEIYYETSKSYDIENGFHVGQTQGTSAEYDLDFFNCFVQGNGAESYRVKDALNKNYLNIDTKPTSTAIEEYQEIRRSADITYSEAFVESSNINGLNVFNLSTGNFKDDLDKQFGSVQILQSRQNDILVIQEEKAGKVLFDKDAIYTAEGNSAITSMPGVLGQWVPYAGNRGIGKNPESFSIDEDGRVKYASVRNGSIVRLSLDGIEDIMYGVKSFFRDLFIKQPNSRIISGYDPFLDQVVFSIGNEPIRVPKFQCSNEIIRSAQDVPFTYELQLNNLGGDIVFTYDITSGNATIVAEFNGLIEVASNVSGTGTITIPRNSLVINIATITITPIGGPISYTIMNTCPIGTEMEIVMVVLNDSTDSEQTITNRFKTLSSSFISNDDVFNVGPLTRFESIIGLEGVGSFPTNGDLMTIQSFKDTSNNGTFRLDGCNKLGFLVSSNNYTQSDYNAILNNADTQFLSVTESGEEGFATTVSGNFIFSRSNTSQKLYLIWDYTDRNPVLVDDNVSTTIGGSVVVNVLDNDEVPVDAIVEILVPPSHGTASVNLDKTITYTNDGLNNLQDEFTYRVMDGRCASIAKVIISIGTPCSASINANGTSGVYEAIINVGTTLGDTGITYQAFNIADRFEIFYNGVKVADSKYVGDLLEVGPPVSAPGLLGTRTNFPIFSYNGTSFVDTGNIEPDFTVVQSDIADNITEPINGAGSLFFEKITATPTTMKVRVTGSKSTAWTFKGVCPIDKNTKTPGAQKIMYGFFDEANKASTTGKSFGAYLGGTFVTKFFTNRNDGNDFSIYEWGAGLRYINDGVNWWEIDVIGNILSTGTI